MFELTEIMRQKESKAFAEILNRLREGNQTANDILKIKERCVADKDCPLDAPQLFVRNDSVDEYNQAVYEQATGSKYSIKAQDSVIGASTTELREKILNQVVKMTLRNTKQLARNLQLAEGVRTEMVLNVRTDDGLTNGAGNVIKLVQLHQANRPSGVVWVEFDHEDVGKKTRQENRYLYVQGIERSCTPIKPVTAQFAVGKNKAAQVVRKQFPLRLAAAKTVHKSQGSSESEIVVNLDTRRAFAHIHYVALSRVTSIDGLYVTNLCESKIAVDSKVAAEMQKLRTEKSLQLCYTPFYNLQQSDLMTCHLNACSLHKHIDDIRKDFNYCNVDIAIFTETQFSPFDEDEMYKMNGFQLFRNDNMFDQRTNAKGYGGTAVFSRVPYVPGFPYCHNFNNIELTVIKVTTRVNTTIIAVYRSPKVPMRDFCSALANILDEHTSLQNIVIGDFNVNWLANTERQPLYNVMVRDHAYTQLICNVATDNQTLIDHIFTNIPETVTGVLETYFSDHKAIWVSCKHDARH